MSEQKQEGIQQESEAISFAAFLEHTPPSRRTKIAKLTTFGNVVTDPTNHNLITPEIQLHCPNDTCNGPRVFRCIDQDPVSIPNDTYTFLYISYSCSTCHKARKTFSVAAKRNQDNSGECFKLGEVPAYGPPTPPRLIALIGPDRGLFLQGRRCENQGLGIGALTYYKRVVENQKNRILDEIIKVSEKLATPAKAISALKAAKSETPFSRAMLAVKDAIPSALLINDHNPLTLLDTALSDGLHERTDEECLETAHSIRVILVELSERLAQALKDGAELNQALSILLKAKNKGDKDVQPLPL